MNFFNSLFGKITKSYNLSFEKQDYMVAEQLTDALLLSKRDGNYQKKKFLFESFFLSHTDRTAKHPYFIKTKEGKNDLGKKIGELAGFEGREILLELDPLFDLYSYFNLNWFHDSLLTYTNELQELAQSKLLYIENKINFFDYFIKRLQVYDIAQPSEHVKYYDGIDRDKYKNNLRKKFQIILS